MLGQSLRAGLVVLLALACSCDCSPLSNRLSLSHRKPAQKPIRWIYPPIDSNLTFNYNDWVKIEFEANQVFTPVVVRTVEVFGILANGEPMWTNPAENGVMMFHAFDIFVPYARVLPWAMAFVVHKRGPCFMITSKDAEPVFWSKSTTRPLIEMAFAPKTLTAGTTSDTISSSTPLPSSSAGTTHPASPPSGSRTPRLPQKSGDGLTLNPAGRSKSGSISTGAAVGMSVGAAMGTLVLGALALIPLRRCYKRRKAAEAEALRQQKAAHDAKLGYASSSSDSASTLSSDQSSKRDVSKLQELEGGAVKITGELPYNNFVREADSDNYVREAAESEIHEAPDTSIKSGDSYPKDEKIDPEAPVSPTSPTSISSPGAQALTLDGSMVVAAHLPTSPISPVSETLPGYSTLDHTVISPTK